MTDYNIFQTMQHFEIDINCLFTFKNILTLISAMDFYYLSKSYYCKNLNTSITFQNILE